MRTPVLSSPPLDHESDMVKPLRAWGLKTWASDTVNWRTSVRALNSCPSAYMLKAHPLYTSSCNASARTNT